jgi:hypothetical protein
VIADGDTVGSVEGQRIVVRQTESMVDQGRQAYRLML